MMNNSDPVEVCKPVASPWLKAHDDPSAGLYTFSQCLSLADIHGDGDHKLVIADLVSGTSNSKLKVYQGTGMVSESALVDIPTAVVTFHMDSLEPRVPAVGIASGSHVYIYKNLRPYFKFTLPSLPINPTELDIWNQVKEDRVDVVMLKEVLEGIRNEIGEANMTTRSKKFFTLDTDEMLSFVNVHKTAPLKKQTVITCLGTLKKSMADDDAISCLVLGTENRSVYVLDPQAFTILTTVSLPSIPVFVSVQGLFDVDYQITVSCRDGRIYILKRGAKEARPSIELPYQPVCIETVAKNIVVGCSDMTLHCYTSKGKLVWRQKMPAIITAATVVDLRRLGTTLLAVATGDGKVSFFSDKLKVEEFEVEDVVMAMQFGRYGREESTLIMITSGGGLLISILKRTARFEACDPIVALTTSKSANSKLNIPKKTKLFIDQTMRERENSTVMHRVYQQDLYKLRLNTARRFVEALESSLSSVSSDPLEPVKLSVKIQGLGPVFCMKVELQNTSDKKTSSDLAVTFVCDPKIYSMRHYFIPVPMLVPSTQYVFKTMVTCLTEQNVSNTIKVLVFKLGQLGPLVTAIVSMPLSELPIS